jgi:hypothetical protein
MRREGWPAPAVLPLSLVYPDGAPADEKALLPEIERLYGLSVRRIPALTGYFNGAHEYLWHSEAPRLHSQWNSTRNLFETVRCEGSRVLVTGFFGDQVLANHGYLVDLVAGLRWRRVLRDLELMVEWMDFDRASLRRLLLLEVLRRYFPSWLTPTARRLRAPYDSNRYPRWFSKDIRRRALERAQTQRRQHWPGVSNHAMACYHQTRAHVLLLEESNKTAAMFGIEVANPFMDRDLVAFIMSVPGEVVNLQGVPKGLYREAMRDVLPEAVRLRKWKADLTYFVNQNTADLHDQIEKYIGPGCLASRYGLIDVEAAHTQLAEMRPRLLQGQTADPTRRISGLLGLELWLRVFFAEEWAGKPVVSSLDSHQLGGVAT